MTVQAEQVLSAALALPPIDRAALIEAIFASFDFPARAEVDALWATEVEDRLAAYERGELAAVPAAEVFARLQAPSPR